MVFLDPSEHVRHGTRNLNTAVTLHILRNAVSLNAVIDSIISKPVGLQKK
jgi:hypothetical protein